MKKLLLINLTLLTLFFSCDQNPQYEKKQPGNKAMAGDMILADSENLLDDETKLSRYIEETESVFSRLDKIEFDKNSKTVFLLSTQGEIIKIDQHGNPLLKIKTHGKGPGEMTLPMEIKVRNNKLYVLDNGSNKVLIFDLFGKWEKDVVFHDLLALTFEVDSSGLIIIPKIFFQKESSEPLFIFFNEQGQVVREISKNSYIDEDVVATPMRPILSMTPNSNLLLTFKIQGRFYLFNLNGELLQTFSIQGGPEWTQSEEQEKELAKDPILGGHSWPHRVVDISFNSCGNIFASWGGKFRGRNSIIMIYDREGHFIGRLFGNDQFPYPPTCFTLENDSIAWLHSSEKYMFARCKIQADNKER